MARRDTWYRLGTGHRVGLVTTPRILLGQRVRLARLGAKAQRVQPLHLGGHPFFVPACAIRSGCAAHSHARLAQQFPRLRGHAADARALRRGRTLPAGVWFLAASTQGRHQLPVRLAAYVREKWHSWSDVTPTDDFLCATLTLYWITQSITSSMRDYWDNRWHPVDPAYVSTPTAFGVFAHQTVPEGELPRSYLERLYNIQRWTVFPRGGHFAPAEEPAAVAGDLTAFFRGLS